MKKLAGFLFLFIPLVSVGQELSDETALIQSLFGSDKKNIVSEFVDGEKKKDFLVLYDQYETSRKALGQKKVTVLSKYVKNYSSLTEKETEEVMKEIMQLSSGQEKLMASYYKKIKKKCGVVAAAQFYQIEWYLLSEIRTAVLESIPIINQLENKK
jgi:hypothetical protein